MDERSTSRRGGGGGISDAVLRCIMPYVQDPRDRDAVSLVCRHWYEVDSETRKHVTIALCYSTSPQHLRRRFSQLESLKLKGKPRPAMFNLMPEDWGGHATPWIHEFARSFDCLKSLHLRRMIVTDRDLEILAQARGRALQVLKLDKCSGFSTDGLLYITRSCRNLRILFLEESIVVEKDGQWLHELALNNSVLEILNFYMTYLTRIKVEDLERIARNCRSLVSVKISDCEVSNLVGFFHAANKLEEFGGGFYNENPEKYSIIEFPPKLCCLGLSYMAHNEMHMIFPFSNTLKKLDLLYSFLVTEDHCLLIQKCPNLEVLEVRNVIGDSGLEIVAQSCKKLRRLRIERGADDQDMEDEHGIVSQRGLIALAQGCPELEYIAAYVTDITNECLECMGRCWTKLCDFRIVLLERQESVSDLPLDNGVRALLSGCQGLKRFALYLRPGGLTDVGLSYIGKYSPNVQWILLGPAGESDKGLMELCQGCPNLQKLEMRGCCFSERALAIVTKQLRSLRYLWVQGYRSSQSGHDLLAMALPFWNIELLPPRRGFVDNNDGEPVVMTEQPAQILAYHSLSGKRTDFPDTVVLLDT